MTDREKVIRGLECCLPTGLVKSGDACNQCPYGSLDKRHSDGYCIRKIMEDALELLKEQEPVAHAAWLCKETSTAYDLYGVKTWAAKYKCSKCGSTHRAIEAHMSSYSYCPNCGARMDKDAKEGDE